MPATATQSSTIRRDAVCRREPHFEAARDLRHPISRWYLLPAVDRSAARLAATRLRPWHVTLFGLLLSVCAVVCMSVAWLPLSAAFVLAAWTCDRLDGKLARRQGRETAWGAWLDANLDELTDLLWHAALAFAAAQSLGSQLPWALFSAFVAGKYLLFHSVQGDAGIEPSSDSAPKPARLHHLPGNADVRVHLLIAALLTGWLIVELLFIAVYYNVRWIARYGAVLWRIQRQGAS